ncbi:MAG: TlpA family protein disulfide reductase [Gammaproteobacteria bacterium SHHR-1]|uniref:TlpA family protein disulfide reductase n=1 Tax=Magnetovirga frankeli TaxID=947516 RepID=UPI001293EC4D|nr:TlpA family protein disulfide reductase [gamma proteobacterium SS-5]
MTYTPIRVADPSFDPATRRLGRSGWMLGLGLWLLVGWPGLAAPIDFRLNDLDGKPVDLGAQRGHWLVLNFWAHWCAPCRSEIPELIRFQTQHPDIRLFGIHAEQADAAQLRDFIQRFEPNYPQLLIGELPLTPIEPLKGLPTTAIINPQGELVSKHTGAVSAAVLERFFIQEGVIGH